MIRNENNQISKTLPVKTHVIPLAILFHKMKSKKDHGIWTTMTKFTSVNLVIVELKKALHVNLIRCSCHKTIK